MKVVCAGGQVNYVDLESMDVNRAAAACSRGTSNDWGEVAQLAYGCLLVRGLELAIIDATVQARGGVVALEDASAGLRAVVRLARAPGQ